jgi:hypothetical protein
MLLETEEEKKRLEGEAHQLKEMCRRELDRSEAEITRNSAIIADYKQVCVSIILGQVGLIQTGIPGKVWNFEHYFGARK